MQEYLLFEWDQLSLGLGPKIIHDFSVKGLLNVACDIYFTNHNLFVYKRTTEHLIHARVFLAVQCHCSGSAQNLTFLFFLRGVSNFAGQRTQSRRWTWTAFFFSAVPESPFCHQCLNTSLSAPSMPDTQADGSPPGWDCRSQPCCST